MSDKRHDAGRPRTNGGYVKIYSGIKDLSDEEFWSKVEETMPTAESIGERRTKEVLHGKVNLRGFRGH